MAAAIFRNCCTCQPLIGWSGTTTNIGGACAVRSAAAAAAISKELRCGEYAPALALEVSKHRQIAIRNQQIVLRKRTDVTVDTLAEQGAQRQIAAVSRG